MFEKTHIMSAVSTLIAEKRMRQVAWNVTCAGGWGRKVRLLGKCRRVRSLSGAYILLYRVEWNDLCRLLKESPGKCKVRREQVEAAAHYTVLPLVTPATKLLQQLRLVAIRQGESTRVLDYRHTGGLELLVSMLFRTDGGLHLEVARGLVEMRGALGPDIAGRAALRRSDDQAADLGERLSVFEACSADDLVAREAASFRCISSRVG